MKILFLSLCISLSTFAANPVRIQMPVEAASLDPYLLNDIYGFSLACNINEGLMRLDGQGKLQKGHAESYSVSKDQKKYTFKIKTQAQWSDGKAITADDFVRGFRHALDAKTGAPDASMLFAIKGAENFYKGKEDKLGLTAKGQEFIIELERPEPALLQILTMPLAGPMREVKKWEATDPTSGAFVIKKFKPDQEIVLEPNPFYPTKNLPSVVYKVIAEENTALNMLESNNLDIINSIPQSERPRLEKAGLLRKFPSASTYFLSFNLKKMSDVKMRKAIAGAINREEMAKLFNGVFKGTTSYLPSSILGSENLDLSFKSELAAIKASANKKEIHMAYSGSAVGNLVAQKIQNDLEKNANLKVKLDPLEWKAYLNLLNSDPPEIFYIGFGATFDDPLSHLKSLLQGESNNRSNFYDAKYEDLVKKIKVTSPGTQRTKLIKEAHRIIVKEHVAIIPLMERNESVAVGKRIKSIAISPYAVLDLRTLKVD